MAACRNLRRRDIDLTARKQGRSIVCVGAKKISFARRNAAIHELRTVDWSATPRTSARAVRLTKEPRRKNVGDVRRRGGITSSDGHVTDLEWNRLDAGSHIAAATF
jgi:hypothetical protein